MTITLEVRDHKSNLRRIVLHDDTLIGRGSMCNLLLPSRQVSRRHCLVRVSSDAVSIIDLDSRNGTLLNGDRIQSGRGYRLVEGDEITVGPVEFVLHYGSPADAATEATPRRTPKPELKAGISVDEDTADFRRNANELQLAVERVGDVVDREAPTDGLPLSDSQQNVVDEHAESASPDGVPE